MNDRKRRRREEEEEVRHNLSSLKFFENIKNVSKWRLHSFTQ
jgi:hypothetical protein